jgi:hypothetical protein
MKTTGAETATKTATVAKTEARGYQAPRIVTHSAEALKGATLAVNACTGFSRRRGDGDSNVTS